MYFIKLLKILFAGLMLFFLNSTVVSQPNNESSVDAIRAEKIYTISHGIISNALILIKDGKITYAGPDKEIAGHPNVFRLKLSSRV